MDSIDRLKEAARRCNDITNRCEDDRYIRIMVRPKGFEVQGRAGQSGVSYLVSYAALEDAKSNILLKQVEEVWQWVRAIPVRKTPEEV